MPETSPVIVLSEADLSVIDEQEEIVVFDPFDTYHIVIPAEIMTLVIPEGS